MRSPKYREKKHFKFWPLGYGNFEMLEKEERAKEIEKELEPVK